MNRQTYTRVRGDFFGVGLRFIEWGVLFYFILLFFFPFHFVGLVWAEWVKSIPMPNVLLALKKL